MSLAIQKFLQKLSNKIWLVGFDKGKNFFKPFLYFILLYPLFYSIYTTDGKIGQCTKAQSQIFIISYYFPFSSSIDYFKKIQNTCFENNFVLSHIFFSLLQSTVSLVLVLLLIFVLLSIFFSYLFSPKKYKLHKKLLDIVVEDVDQSFDLEQKIIEFIPKTDFYKEQKDYLEETQEKELAIKNHIENNIEKNFFTSQFKFSKDYPFLKIDNDFLEQDSLYNQFIVKNFENKNPKITRHNIDKNFNDNTFLAEMKKKQQGESKLEEELFLMEVAQKKDNNDFIDIEKMIDKVEENVFSVDAQTEKKSQDIFQEKKNKANIKEADKDIERKENISTTKISKNIEKAEIGDIFSIYLEDNEPSKKEISKDVCIEKVKKMSKNRS